MKSLLFTAILSLRKRSEQILIKFAILLQVRLTHAQTFFRGVLDIAFANRFQQCWRMRRRFSAVFLECCYNKCHYDCINKVAKVCMAVSVKRISRFKLNTIISNTLEAELCIIRIQLFHIEISVIDISSHVKKTLALIIINYFINN
jgi:hypothetical protein